MNSRDLWAKSDPYHPLWKHLLDVAAVSGVLLKRFGPIDNLPNRWVMYLCALHDVGKADPHFQNKDPKLAAELQDLGFALPDDRTRFRHEARSAEWLKQELKSRSWHRYAIEVVTAATRGHHGDFRAGLRNDEGSYDETEPHLQAQTVRWLESREELAAMVWEVLSLEEFTAPDFDDASRAGIQLAGLIVLADWIASNADLYGYEQLRDLAEPTAYFAAAERRAAELVRSLELDRGGAPPETNVPSTFHQVWTKIDTPRPFQQALERLCLDGLGPGLAILEAPMGEGKTEAAIYLARHWNGMLGRDGLYLALPSMATSNQMHSRYAAFLSDCEGAAPRLIHGMSWLVPDEQPAGPFETWESGVRQNGKDVREWFGSSKRALLAPEGVGTIDQALMAALNVKHGFLRLAGLSARTLVIDEVHAYDAYMRTILARLLAWCRTLRIPVVLLSATLTRHQKQELVEAYGATLPDSGIPASEEPYPLLTFAPWDRPVLVAQAPASASKTVEFVGLPGQLPAGSKENRATAYAAVARLAIELCQNGGCICVLMNTVAAAQAVYDALGSSPDKLLFHARFIAKRRGDIETQVVAMFGKGPDGPENPARPSRCILVCTQVVEQSLDVDFDAMITEMAPIDLILQRIGRIWRHERGARQIGDQPRVYVLMPPDGLFQNEEDSLAGFGPTGLVYKHHDVLLATLSLLRRPGLRTFSLPNDFRPLVESGYSVANPTGISDKLFATARAASIRMDGEAETGAITHLIPPPCSRVFSLAGASNIAAEDESGSGEKASYLHAQTRLGDETRGAIFLNADNPAERSLFEQVMAGAALRKSGDRAQAFPGIGRLKSLFLCKANIPAWWLMGLQPDGEFRWVEATDGPDWARNHVVFEMRNAAWRGQQTDRANERRPPRAVELRNDDSQGLTITFLEATPDRGEKVDADTGSAH